MNLLDDLPDPKNDLEKQREEVLPLPAVQMIQSPDGLPGIVDMREDQPTAAIPENLVCQIGPCKHYIEILTETNDSEPQIWLRRFCRRLQAGNELMELTEGIVFACNCYHPPWWLRGSRKRKQQMNVLLANARNKIGDRDG